MFTIRVCFMDMFFGCVRGIIGIRAGHQVLCLLQWIVVFASLVTSYYYNLFFTITFFSSLRLHFYNSSFLLSRSRLRGTNDIFGVEMFLMVALTKKRIVTNLNHRSHLHHSSHLHRSSQSHHLLLPLLRPVVPVLRPVVPVLRPVVPVLQPQCRYQINIKEVILTYQKISE